MKGAKNKKNSFRYLSPKVCCKQLQSLEVFFLLCYFYQFRMLWDWRKEENINDAAAFNCLGTNP